MKNYKITKKLLALLLSVLMVFSSVSVSAVEGNTQTCTNHTFGGNIEKVAVTCETDGYEKNICSTCNEEYEVIIPATGHEFDENGWTIIQEAEHDYSRVKQGVKENKCINNNCKYKIYDNYSIPHEFSEFSKVTTVKTATCVSVGQVNKVCDLCRREVIFYTKDVDPEVHNFSEDVHIIDSGFSCKKDGKGIRVCKDCNAIGYVTVSKNEYHKYLVWEVDEQLPAAATCSNGMSGLLVKECKVCNAYREEKTFYADHVFTGKTKGVAATCTEIGYEEGVCSVCDNGDRTIVENVLFVDDEKHSWLPEVEYNAATCTASGRNIKRCKNNINHIEYVTVESGHKFDKAWTVVEPTCKEDGYKTNTCSECGEVVTETISNENIEHDFDLLKIKITIAPNCDEEGSGEIWCDVCQEYIATTLPKHSATLFEAVEARIPATCISKGQMKYTCKVCSHAYYKAIPVDPEAHNPGDGDVTVVEPTCCTEGISAKMCRRIGCGKPDMSTQTAIAKTNKHIVNDWETTKAATCVEGGEKVRACSNTNCKFSESVVLGASHNFTSWSYNEGESLETATCKKYVIRTRFCRNEDCPIKVEEEKIYGDHVEGSYEFINEDDNCITGGRAKVICSECNQAYAVEDLAPGNHLLDYNKVIGKVESDDVVCSGKIYKCLVCNDNIEEVKNHDFYIITSEVPATCEIAGSTVEFACKNCNYYVASEPIVATGHEFVWGEKGTVRCTKCGYFESENGVACGHFCHNKTLMAKILLAVFTFFGKIFGLKHFCDCGTPHYHQEETTIISQRINEKGKIEITYSCTKCKVAKKTVVLK